jgi:hypothetical protein
MILPSSFPRNVYYIIPMRSNERSTFELGKVRMVKGRPGISQSGKIELK